MILSDQLLKQRIYNAENRIVVSYLFPEDIQPNSIDLRLSYTVRMVWKSLPEDYVFDYRNKDSIEKAYYTVTIPEEGLIIEPGEFLLGVTESWIEVPRDLTATLEGLSSIGRGGLNIQNAGRVDSGWKGDLTLELLNTTSYRIRIYGGMRIAQIVFAEVAGQVQEAYGDFRRNSKYQDSIGPALSREYVSSNVAT